MKKILVAFNATYIDLSALQYAIHETKTCNGMLVGVLIHDLRYSNYTYGTTWEQPIIDYEALELAREDDKEKINYTIVEFKKQCTEAGVHYKLHVDKGIPMDELLHETIFADMLVISSHLSFFTFNKNEPSAFVKDLLHDAHCPVMIVPDEWVNIQQIIFCYDGSPSSVFAIKQFSYVLSNYCDKAIKVVTVNETTGNHLIDNTNIKDLLKTHFKNLHTEVVHGMPEVELIKFIKKNSKDTLVVIGAYGRSSLSRFFHQSIANPIIKELKIPLFIAHQ